MRGDSNLSDSQFCKFQELKQRELASLDRRFELESKKLQLQSKAVKVNRKPNIWQRIKRIFL